MISKLYEMKNLICSDNISKLSDIAQALKLSRNDIPLPGGISDLERERIFWIKSNLSVIPLKEVEGAINVD
ncbi:hypothetical protein KP003_10810 [Geomonas nitrogeniifigens]|uniref:hypothetical protein n=1 Tax=Geomonas diazotrophica TaxID=2843197 RepID=UPI001C2B81C7|nr:hypothetical protein [Geomonas nitrogeniifigens]QXE84898.1 hypothetical protein KP003_10810 [Geomonas nitrogeniifigens]